MKFLLSRLEPMFDWIIIDSPPSVLVSDAGLLANYCDGVLLVVRSNSTPVDAAKRARKEFAEKNVVGVVLNAKRLERHQTWRQVVSPLVETGVGYAVLVGGLVFVVWVFGLIVKNWEVVRPILLVIGVGVVGLAVALLVLYLVVRVVRVAWKGR